MTEQFPEDTSDTTNDHFESGHKLASLVLAPRYAIRPVGLDNLFEQTQRGPAIVAANHLRMADSFAIAKVIFDETGYKTRFGAKEDYFNGGGINDTGILGGSIQRYLERTGQFPVDRTGSIAGLKRLKADTERIVEDGDMIGLHFEGTRSRDGRLYEPLPGMAFASVETGAPILPVGLRYTDRFARRAILEIHFGDAIDPATVGGESRLPGAKRRQLISELTVQAVAELSGQTRAFTFAPTSRGK